MDKNKALEEYRKLGSLEYFGGLAIVVFLCAIDMAPTWLSILVNDTVYQRLMAFGAIEIRLIVSAFVVPLVLVCYNIWLDILFFDKLH